MGVHRAFCVVGARLADDGDLEGDPRRKGSIKSQA